MEDGGWRMELNDVFDLLKVSILEHLAFVARPAWANGACPWLMAGAAESRDPRDRWIVFCQQDDVSGLQSRVLVVFRRYGLWN